MGELPVTDKTTELINLFEEVHLVLWDTLK